MRVKRWLAAIAVVALVGVTAGSSSAATRPIWRAMESGRTLGSGIELLRASCVSANFCMTVGEAADGGSVAASGDGTSWTRRTTAKPGDFFNTLSGVSCVSDDFCAAVGVASNFSGVRTTIVEMWDGSAFSLTPSPNLASNDELTSVSCTSPTFCLAVGDSITGTLARPIAELWDGTSWTLSPITPPTTIYTSYLEGVSCPSATVCLAVGAYQDGTRSQSSLIEAWNGTTWTQQTGANPSSVVGLASVSCVATTACVAAGLSVDTDRRPIAETFDGVSWKLTPTPDAPTPGHFNSISCSSATACVAVGNRVGSTNASIIDIWNGSTWSVPTIRTRGPQNLLLGVSCTASSQCVAVGVHYKRRKEHPLIETNAPRPPTGAT